MLLAIDNVNFYMKLSICIYVLYIYKYICYIYYINVTWTGSFQPKLD